MNTLDYKVVIQSVKVSKDDVFAPSLFQTSKAAVGGLWFLTWVEVFGFGQFDGGSGLFLQLDDGLTSLTDDRARRIAGNQNLQEVLAFLCSRKEETGSQRELQQGMLFTFILY